MLALESFESPPPEKKVGTQSSFKSYMEVKEKKYFSSLLAAAAEGVGICGERDKGCRGRGGKGRDIAVQTLMMS